MHQGFCSLYYFLFIDSWGGEGPVSMLRDWELLRSFHFSPRTLSLLIAAASWEFGVLRGSFPSCHGCASACVWNWERVAR